MLSSRRRSSQRGQSIVELALLLPLLLLLFLAIADLARLYTTMLSVESAAREAADFGAFNSSNWQGASSDPTSNFSKTVVEMETRACIASRSLPDYDDPDDDPATGCVNPALAYELIKPTPSTDCAEPTNDPPCRVKVTLQHQFNLIAPLNINAFGTQFGLPSQITFERASIFAISDYGTDTP